MTKKNEIAKIRIEYASDMEEALLGKIVPEIAANLGATYLLLRLGSGDNGGKYDIQLKFQTDRFSDETFDLYFKLEQGNLMVCYLGIDPASFLEEEMISKLIEIINKNKLRE